MYCCGIAGRCYGRLYGRMVGMKDNKWNPAAVVYLFASMVGFGEIGSNEYTWGLWVFLGFVILVRWGNERG